MLCATNPLALREKNPLSLRLQACCAQLACPYYCLPSDSRHISAVIASWLRVGNLKSIQGFKQQQLPCCSADAQRHLLDDRLDYRESHLPRVHIAQRDTWYHLSAAPTYHLSEAWSAVQVPLKSIDGFLPYGKRRDDVQQGREHLWPGLCSSDSA